MGQILLSTLGQNPFYDYSVPDSMYVQFQMGCSKPKTMLQHNAFKISIP